jgi:hypothetical protein
MACAAEAAEQALAPAPSVARRDKGASSPVLLHHVTTDRLREAYRAIRPQAAPGVDGVTWHAYRQGRRLACRTCTTGSVGALPGRASRRVYVPKAPPPRPRMRYPGTPHGVLTATSGARCQGYPALSARASRCFAAATGPRRILIRTTFCAVCSAP